MNLACGKVVNALSKLPHLQKSQGIMDLILEVGYILLQYSGALESFNRLSESLTLFDSICFYQEDELGRTTDYPT